MACDCLAKNIRGRVEAGEVRLAYGGGENIIEFELAEQVTKEAALAKAGSGIRKGNPTNPKFESSTPEVATADGKISPVSVLDSRSTEFKKEGRFKEHLSTELD